MIYEMLTGLPAERFPSLGDRVRQIAEHPELARLNQLVLRACEPDPSRRFGDACQMLAELTAAQVHPSTWPHIARRVVAAGIVAAAVAALAVWMGRSTSVDVNFVTDPFEATISLDGRLLHTPDGTPYRTACTVPNLPGGAHHVVFRWDDEAAELDAGTIDLSQNHQITARR